MKQQQQANKSYAGGSKQTKKGNLFLVTNLHAMASYLEGTCPELEGDSTWVHQDLYLEDVIPEHDHLRAIATFQSSSA